MIVLANTHGALRFPHSTTNLVLSTRSTGWSRFFISDVGRHHSVLSIDTSLSPSVDDPSSTA